MKFRELRALESRDDLMIISVAHDWVQALPLSDNILVCQRCGYRSHAAIQERPPCTPHGESITSGWSGIVVEKATGKIVVRIEYPLEDDVQKPEQISNPARTK